MFKQLLVLDQIQRKLLGYFLESMLGISVLSFSSLLGDRPRAVQHVGRHHFVRIFRSWIHYGGVSFQPSSTGLHQDRSLLSVRQYPHVLPLKNRRSWRSQILDAGEILLLVGVHPVVVGYAMEHYSRAWEMDLCLDSFLDHILGYIGRREIHLRPCERYLDVRVGLFSFAYFLKKVLFAYVK